jgi:heme-degrading monooxygenase HmoA
MMAVLMLMEVPGGTTAEYERANEIMGIAGDEDAPEGLIQHVAASDGNGVLIADVWESEEALNRFFEERLGAALEQAGVSSSASKPRILPVHNSLTGRGKDAGVLMLIEIHDLGADAYDEMVSKMDAHTADGSQHPCVTHFAAHAEDGGMLIADLWESPEAFGAFAEEQIGPAGAAVGLGPIEPRILPVHNRMRGRAAVQQAG